MLLVLHERVGWVRIYRSRAAAAHSSTSVTVHHPHVAVAGITTPYIASPKDLLVVSVRASLSPNISATCGGDRLCRFSHGPIIEALRWHKAQAKSLANLLLGGRCSDVIHLPRGIVEERSSLACGSPCFSSLYL